MDSDHHLNFHSKAIGTYSTAAPQAILRGNPPTIGIIPKFKKVQSNASRKAGILDFKIEGDRISDGNVSWIFYFLNWIIFSILVLLSIF